ncbi:DedA family protein, partial [Rickettsiaceae bacterium]|nr:DedA family protein [Rickettsiaceae bacterium]
MDQVEIYLLLFTDTLVSNLVFITTPELIFHTMKKFGLHNGYLVVSISSLAFTISIFLNYLFGIICYKILLPFSKEESKIIEQRVSNIRNNKYTPLVLICAAIPFWGKFIILFAGLCRVSFFTTIA